MTTISEVRSALQEMDPELGTADEEFKVGVILLSSALEDVGTDPLTVARFTGYDAEWVMLLATRLQANEIWKDGKVHADWDDPELGGIEFWIDVAVAQGFLERQVVPLSPQEPTERMNDD